MNDRYKKQRVRRGCGLKFPLRSTVVTSNEDNF